MSPNARLGKALALLLVGATLPALAGMDPASLRLERTSEELRLSWVGDGPAYVIFRSEGPVAVAAPSNRLSTRSSSEYVDPLGEIPCAACYYLVLPGGLFTCGEQTCSQESEYCLVLFPGVPEAPPQYSCLTTPAECRSQPTCACVQGAIGDELPPSAAECMQDEDGAITISVYAP